MIDNNIIFLVIIVIIIIIVTVYFYFNSSKTSNSSNGSSLMTIESDSLRCDKNGCPSGGTNYKIYKIHTDYEQLRQANRALALSKQAKSLFTSTKGPANIFIRRHGEKIKTKFGLDCNGIYRSANLVILVETLNNKGFGIDAMVTSNDYSDMHQEQTVMFACWLFTIPLYIYSLETQPEITIKEIYTNPYYNGKNILICWQHNCIQGLIKNIIHYGAKAKGIKNYKFKNPDGNSFLPYWDDNNYETLFHFDEQLNFTSTNKSVKTCYKKENGNINYDGKKQACKSGVPVPT